MSNRINITCGHCKQVLAVDPAAAGQHVQCPRCQQRSVIPGKAEAPVQTTSPKSPKSTTPQPTIAVACPSCRTRMKVKAITEPAVATCPQCKTKVQIPAASRSAGPSTNKPTQSTGSRSATSPPTPATATSQPQTSKKSPAGSKATVVPAAKKTNPKQPTSDTPVAASQSELPEAATDLGQLDLESPSDPLDTPPNRPRPPKRRTQSFPRQVLSWANRHRWITCIVILNLLPLLVAIKFPPILVLSIFNVPVGAVLIGLLLIPRQHIVKRVLDKFGAQLASIGAGGVGLIIVAVLVKALPRLANRAGNNPNLDFSNIGAIIGSLITTAIVMVIFITFWRLIGIARLLSTAYSLQLSIMTLLLAIGASSLDGMYDYDAGDNSNMMADSQSDSTSSYEQLEQRRREASRQAAERRQQQSVGQDNRTVSESPSGPPIAIDLSLPPTDAMAARIEAFRERNSRENTVVVKVSFADENDLPREVRLTLQQALRLDRHFFAMFGDQALLLFVHDGPVSEVIEKLTMGKVISVDDDQRTIEFRIDSLGR